MDGDRKQALEFFNGDELTADVWSTKYRFGDERTPEDSNRRHLKEIARTEEGRLSSVSWDSELFEKLSEYGRFRYQTLRAQGEDREGIEKYLGQWIGIGKILLGGSMLQGIGNHESYSSLSNCFVLGRPYDSYGGIGQLSDEMAQVMKRRGGAGIDLSSIRPDTAVVHNQSCFSSGPVLFANRYSNITLEVAQYGRRGALMLSIHINHPDSLAIAKEKQDLTKLTGCNSSIIFSNEFMDAVEKRLDYLQRFPVDVPAERFLIDGDLEYDKLASCQYSSGQGVGVGYVRRINARKAWKTITEYARNTAEPGIIFEDNWYQGGTDSVYPEYKPVTTNPCSEIPMQPYDSCRLMSVNLFGLVKNPFGPDAEFDFRQGYKMFYEQMSICDTIVDLEAEHIKRIIEKILGGPDPSELKEREASLWTKILSSGQNGRRCGCGFTSLGDTLAALGLRYDTSEETLRFLDKLFSLKMEAELNASIDMSIIYGHFAGWSASKEYECIRGDSLGIEEFDLEGKTGLFQRMYVLFPGLVKKMWKHGRRNVSWSTAAPTGSLSILSQTTSGIEPLFSPFYMRRKKCISASERVDYIDPADGQKFTMYPVFHPKFRWWIENVSPWKETVRDASLITEDEANEIFKESPWYGSCANDIGWEARVRIQALVQSYTTHAISSTINLPRDVTADVVEDIYWLSWKEGLKGNTIYRDGSRGGILITSSTDSQEDEFESARAPKRPVRLPAAYHVVRAKDKVYSVIVGFYLGRPYEVFISSGIDVPEKLKEAGGWITGEFVKKGRDWYSFECGSFTLQDVPDVPGDEKLVSLMVSMALRHRTPLKFVIKTLDKAKPIGDSFTYRLIMILSKYDPDCESGDGKCSECGESLIFENGCTHCGGCGWSRCC